MLSSISMRKRPKNKVDKRKRLPHAVRMKSKISIKEVLASVRKSGGRASVAFTSKVKFSRNASKGWKKEIE